MLSLAISLFVVRGLFCFADTLAALSLITVIGVIASEVLNGAPCTAVASILFATQLNSIELCLGPLHSRLIPNFFW